MSSSRASSRSAATPVQLRSPTTPESDTFHASMAFAEIGRAVLPDTKKSVRYLVRNVT